MWARIVGTCLHLTRENMQAILRFSPRLDRLQGVEVVVQEGHGQPGVEAAAEALRRILASNDADKLGPESHRAKDPQVFSKAGQHLPAGAGERPA